MNGGLALQAPDTGGCNPRKGTPDCFSHRAQDLSSLSATPNVLLLLTFEHLYHQAQARQAFMHLPGKQCDLLLAFFKTVTGSASRTTVAAQHSKILKCIQRCIIPSTPSTHH